MDATALAAIMGAVAAVLLVAFAVYQFAFPERSAADRLAEFTGGSEGAGAEPLGAATLGGTRGGRTEAGLRKQGAEVSGLVKRAGQLGVGGESQAVALQEQLMQAGFRGRNAVELFGAARSLGAIVLGLLGLLLVPKTNAALVALGALAGMALGYYAPAIYVSNARQHRLEALMRGFPDALDLLVSTVEAGLGLDAAFRRVAEELESATPELAHELQSVTYEVNAGIPRVEALRRLAGRCGLDELTSLVNVLVQAERFGTSVSRALRVHSQHVRTKRMHKAETKAAQVSPKLTIAMILFILPCLIFVLLGPAIISVYRLLTSTGAA
jgi:tight adherence protein C